MSAIKLYTIHSTKASKIGWYFDEATKQGICVVEFPNRKDKNWPGPRYMYWPVSNEMFSEVFKAKSKGQWIDEKLINNKEVSCQKIGQPKML